MEARVNRILVGFDFSQAAAHAVEVAAAIAGRAGAELVSVTAVPRQVEPEEVARVARNVGYPLSQLEAEALALGDIEKDVRRVFGGLDLAGITPTCDIGEHRVSHQLLESADIYDVDLVVVGAVGRVGAAERPIGLDTMRLVRQSMWPVLVAKHASPFPPTRILTATDLSEPSRRAVGWALELGEMFGAPVEVLTVASDARSAEAQHAEARTLVESLEPHADLSWSVTARVGTPHVVIDQVAREGDFDLLTLGTLGRSGIVEYLIGGTSERVLRALPCSVLLTKEDAFVLRRFKNPV